MIVLLVDLAGRFLGYYSSDLWSKSREKKCSLHVWRELLSLEVENCRVYKAQHSTD
jgi:hypothetical protein